MGAAVFTERDPREGITLPAPDLPGCTHSEEYITGAGTKERLYTHRWIPDAAPKGLAFLCHGYADHTSYLFPEIIGAFFASMGFAVFAIDYVGHGKSSGTMVCIHDWEALCDDVQHHYRQVRSQWPGLKAFLVGESMGGAVALTIAHREPQFADGMILIAPMCKIGDDLIPPAPVVAALRCLARVIPACKLVPGEDILPKCFRDTAILERALQNPYKYEGRTRLVTADQLMKATEKITAFVPELTTPMLILHGAADRVTAPEASQDLYERAGGKDKTLRVYPGAWHALFAEPDPVGTNVRDDARQWLEARI